MVITHSKTTRYSFPMAALRLIILFAVVVFSAYCVHQAGKKVKIIRMYQTPQTTAPVSMNAFLL